MPSVFFSANRKPISEVVGNDATLVESFKRANGIASGDILYAGQAYTLDFESLESRMITSRFNKMCLKERVTLQNMVATNGENLYSEINFYNRYLTHAALSDVNSLVGVTGDANKARLDDFQKALLNYQNALLDLQQGKYNKTPMPYSGKHLAETMVRRAYKELVEQHKTTMQSIVSASALNRNKGNALSNAERGVLLATRSQGRKVDPRLMVHDAFTANKVAKYAGVIAKISGPLTLVVDGTLRYGNVVTVREAGGDWHRESVIQLAGLSGAVTGATLAGYAAAYAGKFVVTAAALSGPIGWALMGIVVIGSIAFSFYSGNVVGSKFENAAAVGYDLLSYDNNDYLEYLKTL